MKITIIGLIFISLHLNLFSQDLYVTNNTGILYTIDIKTCELDSISDLSTFNDIAFNPNGELIGVANSQFAIIDTITGSNMSLTSTINNGIIGATISNENILYTVSSQGFLYSFNLLDNQQDSLFQFDWQGGGDLSFMHDTIYYAAANNILYRYDLKNNQVVDPLNIQIPDGNILGISSLWIDNEIKLIASVFNGGTIGTTTIYEFSTKSKELTELCEIPEQIFGSTFRTEFKTSIELDSLIINCDQTTSITTTNEQLVNIFPNPTDGFLYSNCEDPVRIINSNGLTVHKSLAFQNEINVQNLMSGIYYLICGKQIFRIVKL